MTTHALRVEHDLLGERQVPANAYYGIHTLRALENFPITGTPISIYPELINALACVKQAAAHANQHILRSDLWNRYLFHPQTGLAFLFHQSAHDWSNPHGMTASARPARAKASIARSICSGEWAADICVRMRACPFGTTG